VRENAGFVPPYGTGGALYLRPLLFGHGAQLGLGPAPEYTLMIAANPVGAYY
jgi:branched-chain amino acid aminotransferase